MKLTGFHLLLTYQCTFECDHCFVWGSPKQAGVMSLAGIRRIYQQANDLETITSIYFEGGEPFLYYPTLKKAVSEAAELGFQVGIVTNAYWATGDEDAYEALKPFAGLVQDLTVSSDLFHYDEIASRQVECALKAAGRLGIPTGTISIAKAEDPCATAGSGQIQSGDSGVMHRGRAAVTLAGAAPQHPWESFTECSFEDLRDPGRVHIDPFGNLHVCQGIAIGNIFQTSAREICAGYVPDQHPIVGPLLAGGPTGLVRRYGLDHEPAYADACHLCYEARNRLRRQFPEVLGPNHMYGVSQE